MRIFDGVEVNPPLTPTMKSVLSWVLLIADSFMEARVARDERLAGQSGARRPLTLEQVMTQSGLQIPGLAEALEQMLGNTEEAKRAASLITNTPDPVALLHKFAEQLGLRITTEPAAGTTTPTSSSTSAPTPPAASPSPTPPTTTTTSSSRAEVASLLKIREDLRREDPGRATATPASSGTAPAPSGARPSLVAVLERRLGVLRQRLDTHKAELEARLARAEAELVALRGQLAALVAARRPALRVVPPPPPVVPEEPPPPIAQVVQSTSVAQVVPPAPAAPIESPAPATGDLPAAPAAARTPESPTPPTAAEDVEPLPEQATDDQLVRATELLDVFEGEVEAHQDRNLARLGEVEQQLRVLRALVEHEAEDARHGLEGAAADG